MFPVSSAGRCSSWSTPHATQAPHSGSATTVYHQCLLSRKLKSTRLNRHYEKLRPSGNRAHYGDCFVSAFSRTEVSEGRKTNKIKTKVDRLESTIFPILLLKQEVRVSVSSSRINTDQYPESKVCSVCYCGPNNTWFGQGSVEKTNFCPPDQSSHRIDHSEKRISSIPSLK